MESRSFLSGLKQRRVYRAVAWYIVAAFALWQAADIAIPALSLPESWMTVIVIGALAGLPVVTVLSWLYELKRAPVGRGRSPTVRIAAVIAGALVLVLLAAGLAQRLRRSAAERSARLPEGPVSLDLGIERYFAGEWTSATAIFDAVAADGETPRDDRIEAMRYAVRAYSESGDSAGAGAAMRRLLDLEPPLVLMLPGVESEAVMRLYYRQRQERLERRAGTVSSPVRAVRILDFNALRDPPTGVSPADWLGLGRGMAEILLTDLGTREIPGVTLVAMPSPSKGFNLYRFLDSPEASRLLRPTHMIIGSFAARGDQILVSAWLIDAANGTLRASAQRLERFDSLISAIGGVADDLAEELRPSSTSAGSR